MDMKKCKTCGNDKQIDQYRITNKEKGYRLGECKPCEGKGVYARRMEKAKSNPEWWEKERLRRNDWTREYRKRPEVADRGRSYRRRPDIREKHKEAQRKYKSTESGRKALRNDHLKRKFGITLIEYDTMLAGQNGTCCICKNKCPTGRNLAVDHDHSTGKIRGLLCLHCNRLLGNAKDSLSTLRSAVVYLEQNQGVA